MISTGAIQKTASTESPSSKQNRNNAYKEAGGIYHMLRKSGCLTEDQRERHNFNT